MRQRQQEILAFIIKDTADKGYPPTVREIGKAVGLLSSSTVFGHLQRLARDGYIQITPDSPRAIKVLKPMG